MTNLQYYRYLELFLDVYRDYHNNEDSAFEECILCEMDDIWCKLTSEERESL